MKTLLVQSDINNRDYRSLLEQAAAKSPDLVCLGELATSGCLYEGGEPADLNQITAHLATFDFATMIGLPLSGKNAMRNSYLYHHRGTTSIYNKINLFEPMNEHVVFTPGTTPGLFETDFGRIGVAICYDLRFPELFTELKRLGAEMIFVPAAFPRIRISDWRELLVSTAVDNNVWVMGINATGDDGKNEFGGTSMAVDPRGKIFVQADETHETILEINL